MITKKLSAREVSQQKILELIAEHKDSLVWRQPWFSQRLKHGALNADTFNHYRGQNSFLLALASQSYDMPVWATFKQWASHGRVVRKSQKGMPVIYASQFTKTEVNDNDEETTKKFPVFKYSTVFNISQTEIVEEKLAAKLDEKLKAKFQPQSDIFTPMRHDPILQAENLVAKNPMVDLTIKIEGERAFYRPITDTITVPKAELYKNMNQFYSTLFHEIIHATGAESRLAREKGATFGDDKYSREELVAEMGAAMLCAEAGISCDDTLRNSAAYIASWHSKLKSNPEMLSYAIRQSTIATDYFLNKTEVKKESEAA